MNTIEDLIKDLQSDDEKTRAFAAEDIAYDNLSEGITHLLARLEVEPSRFVREVIVSSLKTMKGPELVTRIIPYLQSDDAFVRNAVIEVLSLQEDLAIEALGKILQDNDKDVRKFTLDVLFQVGTPAAAELIARGLTDPDINNIITAVEYLGRLEDGRWIDLINELFSRSSNTLLRCTSLEAMAIIGDDRSVEYVNKRFPSYQSISFLEQYSFLKFVARQGNNTHLPLIIALMKEKGQVMHKEIINAIEGILKRHPCDYLTDELLAVISDYLESEIREINKYELLVLLGQYRNQEIFTILARYADADSKLMQMGAVEGLGILGDPRALSILSELKEQATDEEVIEMIEKSISKLK